MRCENMLLKLTFFIQASEIENLKARLKQYADYDEIKRELGIMKVAIAFL